MAKGETIKKYQEQDKKAERAYKFYLNKGYTPAQSSAIVGNLIRESGLNPSAVGDNGKAFGLAQWHPDRQAKAKELYGEAWKDFDNQLKFIDWELNNTEKTAGEALKKANSVWEAGRVFTNSYERPKLKFDQDETRQTHVADVYRKYSKTELTDADKSMFKSTFAKDVAPYMNTKQTENISYLPQTELNSTFTPSVNIDYLKNIEEQKQQETQTTEEQYTPQEDNFMQDILSSLAQGVEYVKPVQRDIMEIGGKIPVSPYGVYEFPRREVLVPTKNGEITMKNVDYPILGTDEYGNSQMMYPNKNYKFKGNLIHEQPQ